MGVDSVTVVDVGIVDSVDCIVEDGTVVVDSDGVVVVEVADSVDSIVEGGSVVVECVRVVEGGAVDLVVGLVVGLVEWGIVSVFEVVSVVIAAIVVGLNCCIIY